MERYWERALLHSIVFFFCLFIWWWDVFCQIHPYSSNALRSGLVLPSPFQTFSTSSCHFGQENLVALIRSVDPPNETVWQLDSNPDSRRRKGKGSGFESERVFVLAAFWQLEKGSARLAEQNPLLFDTCQTTDWSVCEWKNEHKCVFLYLWKPPNAFCV